MRTRHFSAGETIFSEGDCSDEAYVLRSGRVEVLKDAPGGPLRLAVLGQGDVLGEMGLLDERPRSATARAVEPVVVDAVSRSEFVSLLLHDPGRSLDLLRALFERLRTMNRLMSDSASATEHAVHIPRVTLIPLT